MADILADFEQFGYGKTEDLLKFAGPWYLGTLLEGLGISWVGELPSNTVIFNELQKIVYEFLTAQTNLVKRLL